MRGGTERNIPFSPEAFDRIVRWAKHYRYRLVAGSEKHRVFRKRFTYLELRLVRFEIRLHVSFRYFPFLKAPISTRGLFSIPERITRAEELNHLFSLLGLETFQVPQKVRYSDWAVVAGFMVLLATGLAFYISASALRAGASGVGYLTLGTTLFALHFYLVTKGRKTGVKALSLAFTAVTFLIACTVIYQSPSVEMTFRQPARSLTSVPAKKAFRPKH